MKAGLADRRREGGEGEFCGKGKAGGGRGSSTFHVKPAPKRGSAFTLIELIGVMAVIGILAAVVLPPMIARIEDAQTTNEDANLEEIARALLAGIKAEGRIPNPNVNPTDPQGWAAMATNYSTLGTNAVIKSVPKATNDTVRRYYLSPQLTNFLGTNYNSGLTWGTNGFPSSAFMMLVSVSKSDLLFAGSVRTNQNLGSDEIIWLQNWAKSYNTSGRVEVTNLNVVGTIVGTSNRWTNRGQFLHVKIVNLRELFCKIDLFDDHTPCSPSASQPNSSGGFKPTSSTWSTNGFTVSIRDTNSNTWENGVSITVQPSSVPLSSFSSQMPGNNNPVDDWRIMEIPIATTNANGNTNFYNYRIQAPNTPYFSINGIRTNSITFFSGLNSSTRKDSTNFYTFYGSNLRLYDASATNVQINVPVTKDSVFRFQKGLWLKD